MKNNSLGTKTLMLAVTLLLLAYFGVQGIRYFTDPLSTTLAYTYQVEDATSLSGWVVRAEQVLPENDSGVLQLQRSEGERVSAGGTVAVVYADQSALNAQAEIAALTTQLEQLQYAQEAVQSAEAALKLDAQIKQRILEYRGSLAAGQLAKAETEGSQLRALVLKRDYTFSETEDFTPEIEALESQIKSLKAQAAGSVRRITASYAGLYSAVVDGYETVLTPGSLAQLTPSRLSAVQADPEASSGVGKLILGDDWYYAAVMPTEAAKALAERSETLEKRGGRLTLRFAKGVERDLQVTVDSVGPDENGRSVVVFRGDTYLAQLTLLRRQSAQVVSETIEGIRVPKEALRVDTRTETDENGVEKQVQVTGVYCVVGMEARFKPVEILYSGDGFALVRSAASAGKESARLRHGDEVIIAARDLYDGKVVG